jgi:hypothetical protein
MKRKKRLADRGRTPKDNYPFPLTSKGERKNRCMEIGGVMVTGGALVIGR